MAHCYQQQQQKSQQEHTSTIKVQLTLYARRLKNVAGAFKGTSDPYCVVTLLATDPQERPTILGKTEVIKNSLNPAWTTAFVLDYEFGKPTRINVGIYDEVRKTGRNKPMGSAMFEVGQVLGTRGNIRAKTLSNKSGVLYARIQREQTSSDEKNLVLTLRGNKLKNVDGLFRKSDPFLEISRRITGPGGHSWEIVYRSKEMKNNLNPSWPPVTISLNRLCGGDMSKPVMVSVLDWEKSGKHTPMGFFETSVNGLLQAAASKQSFELKRKGRSYGTIEVVNASIHDGGGGMNQGGQASFGTSHTNSVSYATSTAFAASSSPFGLALDDSILPVPHESATDATPLGYNLPTTLPSAANMPPPYVDPKKPSRQETQLPKFPQPSPSLYGTVVGGAPSHYGNKPNFVDYISGGCELQMCVAIDFTGSNGDPRIPGTLHYIHSNGQLNDYEKALTAVGEIVGRYDSDQKFPIYGFGAKYSGMIRHLFQVGPYEEASGLGAALEAYRGVFKSPITMSGPTVFTEVIEAAASQARTKQQEAQRIGQQAYCVLLILTDGAVTDVNATKNAIRAASTAPLSIIIVGIGNADFTSMRFLDDFANQDGSRDICQFVEFRRYQHNKIALTQATLDEIPDQVVDYFYSKGIMPLPALSGSKMSLVPDDYNPEEDIDLAVDVGNGGSMYLANETDGIYDETKYGNLGMYADMPLIPPPQPSAPPAPSSGATPYNPAATVQQPPRYTFTKPYQPVQASVVNPPQASFYVRLPQNAYPGMKIQVQNPVTHQNMIVTVPKGVPPGGTFPVSY